MRLGALLPDIDHGQASSRESFAFPRRKGQRRPSIFTKAKYSDPWLMRRQRFLDAEGDAILLHPLAGAGIGLVEPLQVTRVGGGQCLGRRILVALGAGDI